MNNKGADQTAWLRRVVCALAVPKPPKTGFLASRPTLCNLPVHILEHIRLSGENLLLCRASFLTNYSGPLVGFPCPTTIYNMKDTVKPVLSGHLKIDKTKILMENGSLMKVESIAECSRWSILQYF